MAHNVIKEGFYNCNMVLLDEKDPSPHIRLTLSRSIEGSINRDIDFPDVFGQVMSINLL
ncbi:hypothetical protein YC2023_046298 [Brassica napus]